MYFLHKKLNLHLLKHINLSNIIKLSMTTLYKIDDDIYIRAGAHKSGVVIQPEVVRNEIAAETARLQTIEPIHEVVASILRLAIFVFMAWLIITLSVLIVGGTTPYFMMIFGLLVALVLHVYGLMRIVITLVHCSQFMAKGNDYTIVQENFDNKSVYMVYPTAPKTKYIIQDAIEGATY